jgi:hypothetical protein
MGRFLSTGKVEDKFTLIFGEVKATVSQTIKKAAIDSLKTEVILNDVCNKVTDTIMKKHGGTSHCSVFKKDFGSYSLQPSEKSFIIFSMTDFYFVIFN